MTQRIPLVKCGDSSLTPWLLGSSEAAVALALGIQSTLRHFIEDRNGADAVRYNWPLLGAFSFGVICGNDGSACITLETLPATVIAVQGPTPNVVRDLALLPVASQDASGWMKQIREGLSLLENQVAFVLPLRSEFTTWRDYLLGLDAEGRELFAWQVLSVVEDLERFVLPRSQHGPVLIWNADELNDTIEIGDTIHGVVWRGKLSSKTGACLRALHTLSYQSRKHVDWHPLVAALVDHHKQPAASRVQNDRLKVDEDEQDRFENSGQNSQYRRANSGGIRKSYFERSPKEAADRLAALLRTSISKSEKGKSWLKNWVHNRDGRVLFGLLKNSNEEHG